jgi:hypothetical protein
MHLPRQAAAPVLASAAVARDPYLDRLVGRWDLRGRIRGEDVHHGVDARWVMNDLMLEMRFRELDGDPYEAAYFLGFSPRDDVYVLHLLDSAVLHTDPAKTVALGRRDGHVVPFVFDGETGSFVNRFEWLEHDDAWSFELTVVQQGRSVPFGSKRMTRG